MAGITRVGISLDGTLLKAFDGLCERRGYANRSEAIRDLIRRELVRSEWEAGNQPTMGALCLVYEHERLEVGRRLTHLQHQNRTMVVSSLHVHLDEHNCLEVLVLRGRGRQIRALSDRLISTKGVKHGELVMTTAGAGLR